MGSTVGPHIYCPSLRRIKGLDCSTSKCYANAFCTGYLRISSLVGWGIEYQCPDCRSKGLVSNRVIQRLAERLSAARPDDRDGLAKSFVRSRPKLAKPFSAPWPEPPE